MVSGELCQSSREVFRLMSRWRSFVNVPIYLLAPNMRHRHVTLNLFRESLMIRLVAHYKSLMGSARVLRQHNSPHLP